MNPTGTSDSQHSLAPKSEFEVHGTHHCQYLNSLAMRHHPLQHALTEYLSAIEMAHEVSHIPSPDDGVKNARAALSSQHLSSSKQTFC
jgi:hypothetical protein